MPCVRGEYARHYNQILLEVDVYAPQSHGQSIHSRRKESIIGLLDTGATNSCITDDVIKKLQVRSKGMIDVNGVHGVKKTNTYLVEFKILRRQFPVLVTGELALSKNSRYQCLIGMDIIGQGVLNVNFGAYALCF